MWSVTWVSNLIYDVLYLQVLERLETLVGDATSELMADFDLGIGRLVWRDSFIAWLLPVMFILDRDW